MDGNDSPKTFGRSDWIILCAIVLGALAVRAVYLWQYRFCPLFEFPIMDPEYHDLWARDFAEGRSFMDAQPYFRAPLYPWFLGICYKLSDGSYLFPRIVQILLGSMSCGLLFLLARRFFNRTVAAASGGVAATFWLFVYFENELLIVPLIVFLDLLLLWLLAKALDGGSKLLIVLSGLVTGISAIARPNILLFGLAACVWLLLVDPRESKGFGANWRRGFGRAFLFGGACLVAILPVTVRNWTEGDDLVLISSQGGVNFYIGNNASSDGTTAVVPGTRAGWWEGYHDTIAIAENAEGRRLKPSEVSQYFFDQAYRFIRESTDDWIGLTCRKAGFFFNRAEFTNNQPIRFFAERFGPVVRLLPIGFGLIAPLSLLGLILCLKRFRRTFPLWGFCLVYTASVILFFICTRFRMPVVPVLIVLACSAVHWIFTVCAQRRWTRAAIAGLVLVPLFWWTNTLPEKYTDSTFGGLEILGSLELNNGNPRKAVEYYREAIDAFGPIELSKPAYETLLHTRLGVALYKMGDREGAKKAFESIRKRNMRARHRSEYADSVFGLGLIAVDEGKIDEAIKYFRFTLSIAPDYTKAEEELRKLAEQSGSGRDTAPEQDGRRE